MSIEGRCKEAGPTYRLDPKARKAYAEAVSRSVTVVGLSKEAAKKEHSSMLDGAMQINREPWVNEHGPWEAYTPEG